MGHCLEGLALELAVEDKVFLGVLPWVFCPFRESNFLDQIAQEVEEDWWWGQLMNRSSHPRELLFCLYIELLRLPCIDLRIRLSRRDLSVQSSQGQRKSVRSGATRILMLHLRYFHPTNSDYLKKENRNRKRNRNSEIDFHRL